PGATKEYFYKENYLQYELQQKVVLPLFDVGYTDEYGLKELVEKATQTLHGLELTEEKRVIQRLLNEIRKSERGLAVYGEAHVLQALDAGAIEELLVSEGLRRRRATFRCSQCGTEFTRSVADADLEAATEAPCPNCHATQLALTSSEDFVEGLFRRAAASNAKVRLISTESEEGEMLAKAFQGIAAFLRYPWSPPVTGRPPAAAVPSSVTT
ncbi:MAG: hypothetical protein WCA77_07015, partial [Thermoplasmata archaeon]